MKSKFLREDLKLQFGTKVCTHFGTGFIQMAGKVSCVIRLDSGAWTILDNEKFWVTD